MSAYRIGVVMINDDRAGTICETESGYRFYYDALWLSRSDSRAVSLTLPLREEPYESEVLFPFFDGLIPEGWVLNMAIRNWKFDRKDRFGLLLKTCRDCIGNVSIQEVETL